MAASKPMPPMTTNRSSSMAATSRRTRSPSRATSTAPSRSAGTSKLVASRLPVPPGSTARGSSVPARPVTQAITVPSPPWAITSSTPSARALAVWPCPGSSGVVSSHSTSRPAPSRASRVSRLRPSASPPPVAGLKTTATRVGLPMAHGRSSPGPPGRPVAVAQLAVGHPEADAADRRQQPQPAEQGAAEHVAQEVHAPVHARGRHQHRQDHRQGQEQAPDQGRAGPLGGQHGQRPPQGDGRRGVPGGEAGGGRGLVQGGDRGPLAVHQHGHDQEDGDLAGHRHRDQHGLPPAAPHEGGHRDREHGQDGGGQGAADLAGDGGDVVEARAALGGQPLADVDVAAAHGVVAEDLGQQPADPDQGRRQHDRAGEQEQGRGHALAEPPPAGGQGGLAVVGRRVERSTGRAGGHRSPPYGSQRCLHPPHAQQRRRANYPSATRAGGRPCLLSRLAGKSQAARRSAVERRKGATVPSARTWRRAAAVGGLGLAGVYAFEAAQYHRTAGKGFELRDPPGPGTPDFARMVEALTVAPLRQGNRVTVLRNGCEIFPAMLEAIRSATRSINFATYVYWTGSIAPEFAEALAERAEAGVEVNVLLDAVGAAKMDRALIDRLDAAGAKVAWFRPPKWYTLHKLNNRTHRKILVVAGGVGIAEEWTGNCEDPGHWRDTHVRVEGPAARDLLGGFLDNWAEATQCI